ncbi:unnamed protein product [Chironomus riparius]|uniref:Cystatin domain-containing protein n=1 Tax=Chironomus riparius TaxID=315576 RepID=A0A9N9WMZ1_9DIPT|nr:unnamed protein product [Chironomus riparius]
MNSIVLFSLFFWSAIVAAEPINRPMIGGVSVVQDEARQRELVELLKEHIGKLEAGNWDIVEIFRVGQQVVAGMKYFYYGTFSDRHDENKIYASTVTLYIRPWDRFVEINMMEKNHIQ